MSIIGELFLSIIGDSGILIIGDSLVSIITDSIGLAREEVSVSGRDVRVSSERAASSRTVSSLFISFSFSLDPVLSLSPLVDTSFLNRFK